MHEIINEKLGEPPISEDLQKIDRRDLLVSYNFNSFYSSAQADKIVHGRRSRQRIPLKSSWATKFVKNLMIVVEMI